MNSLVKLLNRKLILSFEHTTQISSLPRYLSCRNVVWSKTNQILRKLNIPEPPKRPSTPFIRFANNTRYRFKDTGTSSKEMAIIAGAEWNKLTDSQKQEYNQGYESEMAVYSKTLEAYKKSLTKDQELAIKNERYRLEELKVKRSKQQDLKDRANENGKPKRPASSAFSLFYHDEAGKLKTTLSQAKEKYDALNESQKNAYKQKGEVLFNDYKISLAAWEKQMISKGLTNLVRKSTVKLAEKNKNKTVKKTK